MKMKYLTIFLGLVLCLLQSKNSMAQHCISFDYDSHGNRIERVFYDGCDKDDKNVTDFVEAEIADELSLFPNPTKGMVTLSFGNLLGETSASYNIYDVNGLSVKSGNVESEETTLDVGGFLPGVYLIVINADRETFTRTFVKL